MYKSKKNISEYLHFRMSYCVTIFLLLLLKASCLNAICVLKETKKWDDCIFVDNPLTTFLQNIFR